MSLIAIFLHIKIDESIKTQKEIAKEIGYDNPNVLSMMKHGDAKVPFDKVPALAKALDADPGHLMRLAIEQYWPSLLDVIKRIFGNIVSENELALIEASRKAFRETDPAFTPAQLEAVVALLRGFTPPTAA
jgi:DNA-binding Xre family transcriptional regulator